MKNITRKVKFFITEAQKITNENGQLKTEELPALESNKRLSKVSLEKHFKQFLADGEAMLIKPTEEKEKTYLMDLDYFIKNATEIQG